MIGQEPTLPRHVEETVRVVERLHSEHDEGATSADRLLEMLKARIGRPRSVAVILIAALLWIAANTLSGVAIDPPPFSYLQLALSLGAVCLTILILATQRRADLLASHREKLILQLSFVSEQKTAKLIALMEELRRDTPHIPNRLDSEAQEMTSSMNVGAVSEALREQSEEP